MSQYSSPDRAFRASKLETVSEPCNGRGRLVKCPVCGKTVFEPHCVYCNSWFEEEAA